MVWLASKFNKSERVLYFTNYDDLKVWEPYSFCQHLVTDDSYSARLFPIIEMIQLWMFPNAKDACLVGQALPVMSFAG